VTEYKREDIPDSRVVTISAYWGPSKRKSSHGPWLLWTRQMPSRTPCRQQTRTFSGGLLPPLTSMIMGSGLVEIEASTDSPLHITFIKARVSTAFRSRGRLSLQGPCIADYSYLYRNNSGA
jgi:hypothetical protein